MARVAAGTTHPVVRLSTTPRAPGACARHALAGAHGVVAACSVRDSAAAPLLRRASDGDTKSPTLASNKRRSGSPAGRSCTTMPMADAGPPRPAPAHAAQPDARASG
jgi:hypothetical protein